MVVFFENVINFSSQLFLAIVTVIHVSNLFLFRVVIVRLMDCHLMEMQVNNFIQNETDICFVETDICFIETDICFVETDICFVETNICFVETDICFVETDICFIETDICFIETDIICFVYQ